MEIFTNKAFSHTNSYHVISNFESANKKQCMRMDKKNERIYKDLLNKASRAEKEIKDSILSCNLEVPPPPKPNNLEKYNIWIKRNVKKPVLEQSEAVLFLKENGYSLHVDYEAYQAIDLSKEIKLKEGIVESLDDKTTQFDSVFTNRDQNILRRRSLKKMNNFPMPQVKPKEEETHTSKNPLYSESPGHESIREPWIDRQSRMYNYNESDYMEQSSLKDIPMHQDAPNSYNFPYNTPYEVSYTNMSHQNSNIKPSAPPLGHNITYPTKTNTSYHPSQSVSYEYSPQYSKHTTYEV